jgi:hypothetical protein
MDKRPVKDIGWPKTCPFHVNRNVFVACTKSDCMAWFWLDEDDTGYCLRVYNPAGSVE